MNKTLITSVEKVAGLLQADPIDRDLVISKLQSLRLKFPLSSGIAYLYNKMLMKECDWKDYEEHVNNLVSLVRTVLDKGDDVTHADIVGWDTFLPFYGTFTGLECKQIIQTLSKFFYPVQATSTNIIHDNHRFSSDHLSIAYVSSEFRNHALSHLMMEVPACHRKTQFRILTYNTGLPDSKLSIEDKKIRDIIRAGSDKFSSISAQLMKPSTRADKIRQDRPQILIELNGSMSGNAISILEYSPAPITATILGYPGTTGSSNVHYFIADERTVPQDSKEWMTERIAYLPICCYIGCHRTLYAFMKYNSLLPNKQGGALVLSSSETIGLTLHNNNSIQKYRSMIDGHEECVNIAGHRIWNGAVMIDKSEVHNEIVLTSSTEFGIPEGKFIFASFNATLKYTPAMFNVWKEILKEIPNSILWLSFNDGHQIFQQNLLDEIGPELNDRLIFTPSVPKEDHVRRGLLVDLFLDPWICNGHTTTLDALWSGTPVLTLTGNNYHSRVATSILHVLQLPVLITSNPEEYRDRAIYLASNPPALRRLRENIELRKMNSPLYDVRQFTSNLEDLYTKMWVRYRSGEQPDHILPDEDHDDWMSGADTIDLLTLKRMCAIDSQPAALILRGGPVRVAEGMKRLVSERTPSPPEPLPGTSESIRNELKRPKTLQLFTKILGEPNEIDTPTPSQETITPVTSIVGGFRRSLVGLGAAVGTEKFPGQPGHEFQRMHISFSPPHISGPLPSYTIGQRIVNLIALETAVTRVLSSLVEPENMPNTCMGAIQANQFIQRLEEYFDDGLPRIPPFYEICPNFFRSPQGLLCQSKEQLSWLLRFWKQDTGELTEPAFVQDDINGLKWDTARRKTKMICYLCPPPYPTGNERITANTINTTHFIGNHSGQWYEGIEVKCSVCAKDLTRFSNNVKTEHIAHHQPTPVTNEEYYRSTEPCTESPEFTVNLHETFDQAAIRYINEAGGKIRKFTKIQKLATFTLWLAPACHLIISHLKANPSLISGTSMIGYQFKALLQCHLRTTPCPIVRDIMKMIPNDRKNYATRIFKFHKKEHFFMMLRGLPTKDEMDETIWQTTENGIERVNDAQCKLCGDQRPSSVPSNRFGPTWKADHLMIYPKNKDAVCEVCGFVFVLETVQQLTHSRINHFLEHQKFYNWDEVMSSWINRQETRTQYTIKTQLP